MVEKRGHAPGRNVSATTWSEWPAILKRLEELVASGMDGRDARLQATREFDIYYGVLIEAVARGDVPCIPSPNNARVQARLRDEMFYQGKPCRKCASHERWVSDNAGRACAAARTNEREREARKKAQQPQTTTGGS